MKTGGHGTARAVAAAPETAKRVVIATETAT